MDCRSVQDHTMDMPQSSSQGPSPGIAAEKALKVLLNEYESIFITISELAHTTADLYHENVKVDLHNECHKNLGQILTLEKTLYDLSKQILR